MAETKQEDRRHERALDYEKRAWPAKSEALTRLISACRFVKWKAQLTGPENTDENHRRAATIRVLDQFRDRIGDEKGIDKITAYAAEPVCGGLEQVLDEINVQRQKHVASLVLLRQIGTRLDAVLREPVIDDSGAELPQAQQRFQQRADLWRRRAQALNAIGHASDLDVDAVIALCDGVINVAQRDLKGQYTE